MFMYYSCFQVYLFLFQSEQSESLLLDSLTVFGEMELVAMN